MKKTFIISMLAIAAIAASCQKEENPVENKTAKQSVDQVFTATRDAFVDNNTKGAFSDVSFKWAVGDSIIISDGTTSSKFYATVVNEGVATFALGEEETPLAESGVTYKAYYPTYLAPVEGVINYPQQQKALNGEGGADANHSPNIYYDIPMYCESNNTTLAFKNLCALIKVTISLPGDASDTAFSQIIAQTDEKALYGEATIVDGKLVMSGDGSCGRIAIKNQNSKYVSAVQDYYISIPEGDYADFEFIPQTNSSSDVYNKHKTQVRRLKAGSTLSVKRNTIYTYNFLADNLCYDLSYDRETANCYVAVLPSGKATPRRMFRATRGNETDIIEGIDHAELLWRAQAYNSSDMASKVVTDVSYKDGYVSFTQQRNQGNAVIAVYDSSNNILWSWHIWSLDTARPLTDVDINGVTFLDRNLGALYNSTYGTTNKSSLLTSGYFYQWGRKDPFPGRGQEGNLYVTIKIFDKDGNFENMNQLHTDNRAFGPKTIDGPATIEQSVQNPHKFIKLESGNWTDDTAATWAGDSKTVYDPCPYGYRVPASSDFINWNSTYVTQVVEVYSGSKQCVQGANYTDGTNTSFFALTGQMQYNTGKLAGAYLGSDTTSGEAHCRMWTRDTNHKYMQANPKGAWASRTFSVSSGSVSNAYAFVVRCVKETN